MTTADEKPSYRQVVSPPLPPVAVGPSATGANALLPVAEEPLSAFDLRLRSLDRKPGEPISLCSGCGGVASWSVWLHTPDWMPRGGLTRVLCTEDALQVVAAEVDHARRRGFTDGGS